MILTLEIAPSITGHVFAYGVTRSAAITNMSLALKEIQIRGEIHTNVDYTVDLLNVSNNNNLLNPTFDEIQPFYIRLSFKIIPCCGFRYL